jgi:hypothetical protein
MSTIIQIKRSTSGNAPNTSALAEAELAYSQDKTNDGANAILYIESVNNADNPVIHKIGGKYYTDIVDAATSTNTASTLVKRDANGSFSANVITANTIVANIQGTITGEAASAVIATTANALTTARTITLAGDLEGSASFDGSTNITIFGNVISNSVALGTDTEGDYVANLTAGTGITLSGQTGETANITVTLANTTVVAGSYGGSTNVPALVIDAQGRITAAGNAAISTTLNIAGDTGSNVLSLINDTLTFDGAAPGIHTSVTGGTVTFTNTGVTNVAATAGHIDVSAGTGNVALSLPNTGVVATTYGSTTQIPVITFDAQGRATAAANASISTSFTIVGNSGTDTFNTGDTLQVIGVAPGISTAVSDNTISITNTGVTALTSAGHGIVASVATGNVQLTFTGVGNITGTANEIEVSAGSGNVTIGLPSDVTIQNDLTVDGNLYVNGTAITINSDTISITDPLIHLANNNTVSDVVDIGFEGHYYAGATLGQRHAGLFRDASDSGIFKFFANVAAELENVNVVPTNDPGYTIGTVIANLTGGNVINLLNPIAVADGGTGRNTLTANAVLYGDGTNAVALATGTAGQVLQISAAGLVQFGMLDGGTY